MGKDVKPGTAQHTADRQQAAEQTQTSATAITTHAQRVSAEKSFDSNEQSIFPEEVVIASDELGPIMKDDLFSERKPGMGQEAKTEDNVPGDSENDENILDEPRLLTSKEKSDSSIEVMNTFPSILFQDHIDERITTTSLIHYLEGSEHAILHSYQVERSSEETRAFSAVNEDPGYSGTGEETSGKELPDSFKFDNPPKILTRSPVTYPLRAKRLGLTGKVSVSFLVDTEGQATNIEAVKSEPASVLMTFAGAAEKAVERCRFKPATSEGKPVPAKVVTQIRFENI
jgi:TonB family protein